MQGYIDATANRTRQAARANRSYQTLRRSTSPTPDPDPLSKGSQIAGYGGARRVEATDILCGSS